MQYVKHGTSYGRVRMLQLQNKFGSRNVILVRTGSVLYILDT